MRALGLSTIVLFASALMIRAQSKDAPIEPPLKDSDRRHWAFLKPARPEVPKVKNAQSVRNPIDAFIQAKREEKGLSSTREADKLSLLRRVSFDLTGLPPTTAEIDAFLNDKSPDAYERLVDRLLASPHYGERWAQHWLDLVRYAETNGYEGDSERPHAWHYRDYVVKSFNDDKPFDRFLTEQIAGDELAAGKDVRANSELWVASGMHRCGPMHVISGNVDPEVLRYEVRTEMVMGIGSAFLGLTMNCARCHDHKFDPISQADYYRLEAFFATTKGKDVDFSTPEERSAVQTKILSTMAKIAPLKTKVAMLDAPYQAKIRELKKAGLDQAMREALEVDAKKRTPEQQKLAKDAETLLKVTWDEIIAALSPEDRAKRTALREEQHALEAELPIPPSQAWAVADDGSSKPTYILKRGELDKKGAAVNSGFPRIFNIAVGASGVNKTENKSSSPSKLTRKDLAAWLTSPDHPLTARVFVNRLWQHHFGKGIVRTPNDFGTRGERPTHPELLDWLATEFISSGWKVKHMHRLMVLSTTYCQSSRSSDLKEAAGSREPQEIDPDNRLLWRMNRRRLEGETIRDAVLTASGTLNRELGGPMVRVELEPEVYDLIFTEGEPDGLWHVTKDAKQHLRRSIYLFAKRNVRQPLLEAFDQPDTLTPCGARAISTFAPQALILMNGPFTQAQSRAMAAQIMKQEKPDRWIEEAYRRCFGRLPREAERAIALEYLNEQTEAARDRLRRKLKVAAPANLPADADPAKAAALADFCLALFNANEFVYVP